MKINEQVRARVQSYLKEVEANLEGMPQAERQDLLRQIESHVHEALEARTGGGEAQASDVEAVLSEMDPPASYGVPSKDQFWGLSRGKWALLISLGGLVASGLLLAIGGGRMAIWPPFFLFLGAQIAAFVLGILSWKESFGKGAAITSGALTVVVLLFCS